MGEDLAHARYSPRAIQKPSSTPPRQIRLLAMAFFKNGENASAATVNLSYSTPSRLPLIMMLIKQQDKMHPVVNINKQ